MNIDQRRPYLKTIEADGNQEQLRGVNDGVQVICFNQVMNLVNVVFSYDHDGILVPWHVRVVEDEGQWNLEFHSSNCSPSTHINFDDFGTTLLKRPTCV